MGSYNPGNRVRVTKKDKSIVEGIIMPNPETDAVIIKRDDGYNMGVAKKSVKSVKVLEMYKATKDTPQEKLKHNKNLPTISILHTGGTIASKVDYSTGGVVSTFTPEELVSLFPELKKITNINSQLLRNMWSEDMRFKHYSLMAKAVEAEVKKGVDGVIIAHGTDTLHYTSAALSFMLENLPVPVMVVGSQRSSDRGSSDAGMNLICAAKFIAKTDFCGVAVCMHDDEEDKACAILPATKTRKLHTSRRDAFKPVNDTAIAKVDYPSGKIYFIKNGYAKKNKKNKLVVKENMEEKVGILKLHPNMIPEQFELYKKLKYKGLILEAMGIGQAPINNIDAFTKGHEKHLRILKELVKQGCVVVLTSQCIFGRVHSHVYNTAVKLKQAGIVYGEDMLTETAMVKLAWLLGNEKSKDIVKEQIVQNLRGEITERSTPDEFLE
jgi:glutamyl-tRNA(Gln) amidotransferase subunit D